MTLKRLLIVIAVLVILAGGGMLWLNQVAYTPQGRARIIMAQLRGDATSLHGWLLKHHLVRPGFSEPPGDAFYSVADDERQILEFRYNASHRVELTNYRVLAAADEMGKLGHEVLPIVREALQDDNLDACLVAVLVCGRLRDPATIQPLAKCMRDAHRDHVKFARGFSSADAGFSELCVESLIQIGPEAYGPLVEASKEFDPGLRRTMTLELAAKGGPAAVPQLIEMFEDPQQDGVVRTIAVRGLGKLADNRATDALIRHLSDEHRYVGADAASALGCIDDPKAVSALLKTVNDGHIENIVRIYAAGALARKGREEGLQFLLTMLKSVKSEDRLNVAVQLGTNQINGAFGLLIPLLDDSDKFVRATAALSLDKLHDIRAIPAIKKLLKDSDADVHQVAIDVLHMFGVEPPPASEPASQPGKP